MAEIIPFPTLAFLAAPPVIAPGDLVRMADGERAVVESIGVALVEGYPTPAAKLWRNYGPPLTYPLAALARLPVTWRGRSPSRGPFDGGGAA